MNNKEFKEEVAGCAALLIGVISFLIFASSGNPNALGENLFWAIGSIVFAIPALVSGLVIYCGLTLWEKCNTRNFSKTKKNAIRKASKFIYAVFGE